MIIHNLYFERIAFPPDKTHPPLIIDPDTSLTSAVSL
jgi:hypothetical protein